MIIFLGLFSLISTHLFSSQNNLDQELNEYIKLFNLRPANPLEMDNEKFFRLGEKLFDDVNLSLNKNIACATCHNLDLGSADHLPLALGTGAMHAGLDTQRNGVQIIPRSTPHLYNKGHAEFTHMFWDGRISLVRGSWTYPSILELSDDFLNSLKHPMALQALFPIIANEEMKGSYNNELSAMDTLNLIVERVKADASYRPFIEGEFSLSMLANALWYYQLIEYQTYSTPYDEYLKGSLSALSLKEKKGLKIFATKARCTRCHNGTYLTNHRFESVMTPQIGPGKEADHNDRGRFYVTKMEEDAYKFLVQPLRNVALSPPYMHSGSIENLEMVVEHYNHARLSLRNFSLARLNDLYGRVYEKSLYVEKNPYRNFYREQSAHPAIKNPLHLTQAEKEDLVCFLKKSLTEFKFQSRLENIEHCLDK